MGSEEDASETSGIGSMAMPSESGAINFQATPDSERKVRTECVPPPLPHCHSTPATASEGAAAATPLKQRSNTAPHKLETCEPLQHSPEPTPSATPSTSPSASSLPSGACGGPLTDADSSEVIEKNNASDGGELDRNESSSSIAGGVTYSRDRHGVKFKIQDPISERGAALAERLAEMANNVTIDEKQPQQPSNEQQKPLDKISPITFNKNK